MKCKNNDYVQDMLCVLLDLNVVLRAVKLMLKIGWS